MLKAPSHQLRVRGTLTTTFWKIPCSSIFHGWFLKKYQLHKTQARTLKNVVHQNRSRFTYFMCYLFSQTYNHSLVYISITFWDFHAFSLFRKILNLKSFGNSWGSSYTPCLLQIIAIRFTCGEKKIWYIENHHHS